MNPSNCPDDQTLSGYALGTLPEDQAETLRRHVENCERCEKALSGLDDLSDTVIDALRRTQTNIKKEDPLADPVLLSAMERVLNMGPKVAVAAPLGEQGRDDLLADPSVAAQFGQYRLLERIGRGGMGIVYRAVHTRLDKPVAMKVLPHKQAKSPEVAARFEREMRAIGKLDHGNLVRAYDAGESPDKRFLYLVMELVEGVDVDSLVGRRGPLPIAEACDIVRQAAMGLKYVHEQGLVHRDVKPSNLMVTNNGTVKLLDLGLALLAELPKDELTTTGQLMGTLDYLAPEQAIDSHRVDHRADVYGLGCTLFKLLTGRPPYAGRTLAQVLVAHSQAPIPSLRVARPEVPEALDAVFQKMVAKQPEERQQSMDEVIADLEQFARRQARDAGSTVGAGVCTDPGTKPKGGRVVSKRGRGFDRFRWIAVTVAAGVAGVILLAVLIRLRHPDGSETRIRVPEGTDVTIEVEAPSGATSRNADAKPAQPGAGREPSGAVKFELDLRDFPPDKVIVQIDNDSYAGTELANPVSFKAGSHTLSVKENDKEIHAARFDVASATRQVVRVMTPDRRAAEWALSIGGTARVQPAVGDIADVSRTAGLPPSRFRLVAISVFGSRSLTGDGLTNLSGLRDLRELQLASTCVSDDDLKSVDGLTSLRVLGLAGTRVTDAGMPHLAKLPNLTTLWLCSLQMSDRGLQCLNPLEHIRVLHVQDTQVTEEGLLRYVHSHKMLSSLALSGIPVGDHAIAQIARRGPFYEFQLYGTAITDEGIRHLLSQKSLRILTIGRTRVSRAGIPDLAKLAELGTLDLSDLPWFSDADLDALRPLENLGGLCLSGTAVTDRGLSGIGHFKRLTNLLLDRTSVTDATLAHLAELPRLRTVGLAETKVTQAGVSKAQSALPQCKFWMSPGAPIF